MLPRTNADATVLSPLLDSYYGIRQVTCLFDSLELCCTCHQLMGGVYTRNLRTPTEVRTAQNVGNSNEQHAPLVTDLVRLVRHT